MRKNVIAGLVIICLLFLPACPKVKDVVSKALDVTETILCNPTVEQLSDAVAGITFLTNADLKDQYFDVWTIFANIRDGICVSIPQLREALARFDEAVEEAPPMLTRTRPVPMLKSLRKAVQ